MLDSMFDFSASYAKIYPILFYFGPYLLMVLHVADNILPDKIFYFFDFDLFDCFILLLSFFVAVMF